MIKPKETIKLLSAVILLTALSSCIQNKGVTSVSQEETDYPQNGIDYFITECDTIEKSNKFGYQNIRFQTYTFSSKTIVYCSPKENSRVVDTISVNTEVRGRRTISNNNVFWLEMFHEGKARYIKRANTRIEGCFFDRNDILLGKKNDSIYSIKVIDIEKNEELDSYDFETPSKNREDSIATYLINKTKLIGGKYLIRHQTNKTEEKYSGVSKELKNEFVLLDDRKQFVPLMHSKSYISNKYEWDYKYYKETIYIPIRFDEGKILLIENGDLDNVFNKQTGKLNVIECPEKFKEFEENLIVKKIESQYRKLDEEEEPMYDEDGDEIYIETHDIIYYQWNGTKLVEVK